MFDKQLLRKINSGHCLILVGSGPSCEVGYPSWPKLAEQAYHQLRDRGTVLNTTTCTMHLRNQEYPELFRQLERDLYEDRAALINILKPLLTLQTRHRGAIYELIAKWPFASYLTTNYDDELARYLVPFGAHFKVIRNRPRDFRLWRADTSHLIQKLHSDLDHPDELVLTSQDYTRITSDASGQYFRDRLKAIFSMFDVLVIGHSLTDPDIKFILTLAKDLSDPAHPIYFITADTTDVNESELSERYNIEVITYANRDGTHSRLLWLLRHADLFIAPRTRGYTPPIPPIRPSDEAHAAMALSLYRRLQGIEPTEYLTPLLLFALDQHPSEHCHLAHITSLPALHALTTDWDPYEDAIHRALNELERQHLVTTTDDGIKITTAGTEKVADFYATRDSEKDQAYGQFETSLRAGYEDITLPQVKECRSLAERVIVNTFAARSSMIANKVYAGQPAHANELSDVFGYASDQAGLLDSADLRAAFIEGIYEFLVEPSRAQTDYLASVSQGYFLYHLLGLDPKCGDVRRDIFRKTLWVCDSSIILPLVAIGCHNHDYAVDLFNKLANQDALLCITPNLLKEAWDHFEWALHFARTNRADSLTFLRAGLVRGSFKQNLFLDGYIRLSADGDVGTFTDYLKLVLPSGALDRTSFEDNITRHHVRVLWLPELSGFAETDYEDIANTRDQVQQTRMTEGTYRSTLQVESEAEILVLLRNLKAGKYTIEDLTNVDHSYFISQSGVLDRVQGDQTLTTWSPEAVYRYLSALPTAHVNPELLQQCMLHEYFYAGVSFIDRDRYRRFFGPSINAAKASYETEKARYVADIEGQSPTKLDAAFERTPDLEKPFFTAQMGWRYARDARRREELALRRANEAEERLKILESEKDRAWKTRSSRTEEQADARSRNLQDAKHVRKRRRQEKKRKKKKK